MDGFSSAQRITEGAMDEERKGRGNSAGASGQREDTNTSRAAEMDPNPAWDGSRCTKRR